MNRVHRIGQSKQTTVFRFIVENTIEEKVYSLNRRKRIVEDGIKTKKKETVSIDDIKALFQMNGEQEISATPTEIKTDNVGELFWTTKVHHNNQIMPRHKAICYLE